jgi:hypothetical protein
MFRDLSDALRMSDHTYSDKRDNVDAYVYAIGSVRKKEDPQRWTPPPAKGYSPYIFNVKTPVVVLDELSCAFARFLAAESFDTTAVYIQEDDPLGYTIYFSFGRPGSKLDHTRLYGFIQALKDIARATSNGDLTSKELLQERRVFLHRMTETALPRIMRTTAKMLSFAKQVGLLDRHFRWSDPEPLHYEYEVVLMNKDYTTKVEDIDSLLAYLKSMPIIEPFDNCCGNHSLTWIVKAIFTTMHGLLMRRQSFARIVCTAELLSKALLPLCGRCMAANRVSFHPARYFDPATLGEKLIVQHHPPSGVARIYNPQTSRSFYQVMFYMRDVGKYNDAAMALMGASEWGTLNQALLSDKFNFRMVQVSAASSDFPSRM